MKRLTALAVTLTIGFGLVAMAVLINPVATLAANPPRCEQDGKVVACPKGLQNDKCYALNTSVLSNVVIDCSKYESLTNTQSLSSGAVTQTNCSNGSGGTIKTATPGLNLDCSGNKNPIYALLQFVINWAIRLLGALAVLAIVVSGIQYIVSQGNPEGVKAAKSRLTNAVVGLILLSLMFVILRLLGVS